VSGRDSWGSQDGQSSRVFSGAYGSSEKTIRAALDEDCHMSFDGGGQCVWRPACSDNAADRTAQFQRVLPMKHVPLDVVRALEWIAG